MGYSTSVDPMFKNAMNKQGAYGEEDRNMFTDLMSGGQNALNTSISSAMAAAMPSFQGQLQSMREDGVRRGVSTGDLQTANEGSLASAFQKNIAQSAGSQAMNMFGTQLGAAGNMANADSNRYLDAMTGERDYETAQANAKRKSRSGLFGGLGAVAGGLIGGPLGAEVGGALGSGIGGF